MKSSFLTTVPQYKEGFGGLGFVDGGTSGTVDEEDDDETLFNKLFAKHSGQKGN